MINKVLMLIGLSMVIVFAASTEEKDKFSVNASLGYGFGVGGYFQESSNKTLNGILVSSKDLFLNYGTGLKLSAGMQYKVFEHLYACMNVDYSNRLPSQVDEDHVIVELLNTDVLTSTRYESSQFGIGIGLMSKARVFELVDIYLAVTPGLYFTYASSTEVQSKDRTEYKTPPALSLNSGIGVIYPLSDFASLFLEVGTQTMNVKITGASFYDGDGEIRIPDKDYELNKVDQGTQPFIPASAFIFRIGTKIGIF